MFTGIITCIGKLKRNGSNITIYVDDETFLFNLKHGDSISVNGVCLTVTNFTKNSIEFFVMEETLNNTYLDYEYVNLERALIYGNDLSGHIISGHINNMGRIIEIIDNIDGSKIFIIKLLKPQIIKYKDGIAINGTSLTISNVSDDSFSITLIPYTLKHTTFQYLMVNDKVNIEYNIFETKQINYMERAIKLGELGRMTTSPNPWVGCVIVNHDIIIGEGYHKKCGLDHAEKAAIEDAIKKGNKDLLKGSTVYVTLEPCHHYGRTPPCDKLLIDHGISKVIIGQKDPDPRTNCQGINFLRENGIIVEFDKEEQTYESLKAYLHYKKYALPYCILKVALSLDGHIATESGDSKWITNEKSRFHVQQLRSKCHAIMVGSKTVLKDNPKLTVRDIEVEQQPLRVILDTNNKLINKNLNIFDTSKSKTLIFTNKMPDVPINNIDYQIVPIIDDKLSLIDIMKCLYDKGIMQCLVEGGSGLYTSFIQEGLAQEAYLYRSNINLGASALNWVSYKGSEFIKNNARWNLLEVSQFDNDILCRYEIPKIEVNKLKSSLDDAISALKDGKPIIIMDKADRENEGDLVVAGEKITEDIIITMMRNTTGIICVTMKESRAKRLQLQPMVINNQDPNQTNFTVSCDHVNCKTGISAKEKLETIKTLVDDDSSHADLSRPGHIFPLVGHKNGLSSRQGHTEASIHICELAGLKPVSVISELVNPDGTVMRYNDCKRFALMHDIPLITMDKLITDNIIDNSLKLSPEVETTIKTKEYGEWKLLIFGDEYNNTRVLIKNELKGTVILRVHSDCYTGDVLGSLHCDCGDQLDLSLKLINEKGSGLIIFPANHEGRGIGLINKLKAYNIIKEFKCDTFEANNILGFPDDLRKYDIVPKILDYLGINKIELLTNNKDKIVMLEKYVDKITPLITEYNDNNIDYMKIKNKKYGYKKYNMDEINKKYSIMIITTKWHNELLEPIKNNIIDGLKDHDVKSCIVPGSFEVPLMAKYIINKTKCDGVICLGLILKGETAHFEYISDATINGLMNIQLETGVPIINGILNCYTLDQAKNRLNENFSNDMIKSLIDVLETRKTFL